MTHAAPYPPTTRAKGWRLELDYEQVEQSSTWALAPAEARPWLLMLWMCAWRQVPCGSLPAEADVVRAIICMPDKAWARWSHILMRGWSEADDGRLYHSTITARVLEMLGKRHKEAARKQSARRPGLPKETPADVPRDNVGTGEGTDAGLHRESDTDHLPPVPEDNTKPHPPSVVRAAAKPAAAGRPSRKAPQEFAPDPENLAWAAQHAPAVDIDAETAKFRDHTFATARSDWLATWRNWIRKAAELAAERAERAPSPSGRPGNGAGNGATSRHPPTRGELRMIEACPSLAAPHLRHLVAKPTEVVDDAPRLLG